MLVFPNVKQGNILKELSEYKYNNNSIWIENNRIKIPKLGFIKFKTSKEYKELLKYCKINNATIKYENGEYYAIVNVETYHTPLAYCDGDLSVDVGMKTLATMSDGTKIANLDVTNEEEMIKKYQRKLKRQKHNSNNYFKTLDKFHKWVNKKNNRKKDHFT